MGKQMYGMSMANNVSTHPGSHPLVFLPVQDAVCYCQSKSSPGFKQGMSKALSGVVFDSSGFISLME